MDRGALQATVHGVTKSWTQLSELNYLPPHPGQGSEARSDGLFSVLVPPLGQDWAEAAKIQWEEGKYMTLQTQACPQQASQALGCKV